MDIFKKWLLCMCHCKLNIGKDAVLKHKRVLLCFRYLHAITSEVSENLCKQNLLKQFARNYSINRERPML